MRSYLHGESLAFDELGFHEATAPDVTTLGLAATPPASRLHFVSRQLPLVEVEVASTGPKVIAAAARSADRVMLALGADPERVAWGMAQARAARPDVKIGSFVNVVAHPDLDVARELVSGGLSTFARFSVMHGTISGPANDEQQRVLGGLRDVYNMNMHTRSDSAQAGRLSPEFIDRYAIVGTPEHCVERLRRLIDLGVEKFMVIGPSAGADRDQAHVALRLMTAEVLPALR